MRLIYIWKGKKGTCLLPDTLLLSKHLEGSERVLAELVFELQTLPCTQQSGSKFCLNDSEGVWVSTVCSLMCGGETVTKVGAIGSCSLNESKMLTVLLFLVHSFSAL